MPFDVVNEIGFRIPILRPLGERQRIAFAREARCRRKVVLIDRGSSHNWAASSQGSMYILETKHAGRNPTMSDVRLSLR